MQIPYPRRLMANDAVVKALFPWYLLWVVADRRAVAGTVLTAAAVACFFFARFYYPWAGLGILSLTAAYWVSYKSWGPFLEALAVASVPIAWVVAAVGAAVWGFNFFDASMMLMLWWASMFMVYGMRHSTAVFAFLVPVAWVHAGATIIAGVSGQLRPFMLADSANVSGGFLALISIYLMTGPFRILAIPLIWAMAFTGSRLAAIVFAVVLVAMVLKKVVPWRFAVLTVLAVVVLSIPFSETVTKSYRVYPLLSPPASISGDIKRHLTRAASDIEDRTSWIPEETVKNNPEFGWQASAWLLGLAPMGFMGANDIHSVPLRMIYELGVLPTVVWLGISLFALWVRPRFNASWWMLVAFLGLTVLDYYAWMPFTISIIWWILMAIRLRDGRQGVVESKGHDYQNIKSNNG